MLSESKLQWIKFVQQDKYGTEIQLLKSDQANVNIRRMSLFLDEVGLLRTRGRLENAPVAVEVDSPILLPKGNPLTDLIIADQHNKLMHQGVGHTLASLRQAYWFPSGRQQVRFVLHRCRVCRRWEGTSYGIPAAPPLPSLLVTREPPFSYTGVDFAGPLHIFNEGTIRKAYICLFVCAVTRALHLELAENLTTECFLSAFRRFISRRGVPSLIVSDNAKTFKQASKALNSLFHDVITQSEVVTYSSSKGIKWEFNVERAPWWGGFYERVVGLVKRSLVKVAGKARLSLTAAATILTEIEAVLNTRPLTYVGSDQRDNLPICPQNFLSDARYFALPVYKEEKDLEFNDPQSSTRSLLSTLKARQRMIDKFWVTWQRDYLTTLRKFHQRGKGKAANPYKPREGDVVLIKAEGLKRTNWKQALVLKLITGADGQVRAAQVETSDHKLMQRPLAHLYPLEITAEIMPDNKD